MNDYLDFARLCAILADVFRETPNVTDAKDFAQRALIKRGYIRKDFDLEDGLLDRAINAVCTAREKMPPRIVPEFKRTMHATPTGQFRSKLESRWAAAFDAMRLRWEYEPRLFSEIPYLPDFYLTDAHGWLEIKPRAPDRAALVKAERLSALVSDPVYILAGPPGRTKANAPAFMSFRVTAETPDGVSDYGWVPPNGCAALAIVNGVNWQLVSDTLFRSGFGPLVERGEIDERRQAQQREARKQARRAAEQEGDALPCYLREHVRRDGLEDVPAYLREHVRAGEDPDEF